MARAPATDNGAPAEFPAPSLDGRTLVVGRTSWAIDLEWSNKVDSMTPGQMRAAAAKKGSNLYVANGNEQYATTSTDTGHAAGMPSLALAMADHAGGSKLIGGFDCGDGMFYVIALVDGQVWPGHDNAYPADEARAMVTDFASRQDFDEVYAPQGWYLPQTKVAPLGELLQGARTRRHRLQGTSRRGAYAKVAAAVAITALAYVGYSFYTDYQMQELIREGQREEAAARLTSEREARLNTPIYPPMPSIAQARGIPTLRQCANFMDGIPEHNPGWIASKVECDGSTVTLTMRQDAIGTVNWLYPFIGQYKGAELDTPLDKIATASWHLDPTVTKAWGDVRGQAPAAVSRYLNSQFQEVYQTFTLGPPTRPDVSTTTVGRRPITIQAPWTTMDLELSQIHYLRDDIFDVLDRVQNLVLTSVELSLPDRTWKVRATIYHALPVNAPPGMPVAPVP